MAQKDGTQIDATRTVDAGLPADDAMTRCSVSRPEALESALGKPPPAVIRAFATFSSTALLVVDLGSWIVGGLVAMPWIGFRP